MIESGTTPIACISPNNYSLSSPESVSNLSSPDGGVSNLSSPGEGVPPRENVDLLKKMRLKTSVDSLLLLSVLIVLQTNLIASRIL